MRRVDEPGRRCARRVAAAMREARGRLRRPDGLPRAGRGRPAAHRGADPRRRRRRRHPPVRARLLGAAPAPEGRRDRAGAEPRPASCATRMCARRRRASPAQIGYVNAGTVEFLLAPRRRRPARLHRDEPADPGRAHRHRGDHRRRPGGRPDADRRRRDAGRPRACARSAIAVRGAALQCRITTEDPANGFRPDTGHDHHLPLARRRRACGSTAARSTPAPRSARTSTRCWSSSPAAGRTSRPPSRRARRALAEFRIRGVAPTSRSCRRCWTSPTSSPAASPRRFIDERPELLTARGPAATAAPSC